MKCFSKRTKMTLVQNARPLAERSLLLPGGQKIAPHRRKHTTHASTRLCEHVNSKYPIFIMFLRQISTKIFLHLRLPHIILWLELIAQQSTG